MARRDRVRAPVWIITVAGFVVLSASSFPAVYHSEAERQARAALMDNPAVSIIAGPGYGLDNYTFGAMMTQEMMPLTLLVVALMSILFVVRHTRADEAEGRTELIASYTKNRRLLLVTAMTWVAIINMVLGAAMALGMAALHLESIDWQGSWLFSLAIAGIGLVFTTVAAVTAQLAQSSRGAVGLAGIILGGFYLVRVLGDTALGTLSWLSPFGWALASKAYVFNDWWVLLLALGASIALAAVAILIANNRDYGAGVLQVRPGRRQASRWLNNPLALIVRLQRTSIIVWVVAMASFGLLYGTLAPEVEGFVDKLSSLALLTQGGDILATFLGTVITVFAITAAAFGIISLSRIKNEETSGRAELVLATQVQPVRWLLLHAAVAFIGSVLVLLAASIAMAATAAIAVQDAELFWGLLQSALVYIPALLLIIGAAAALYGLAARAVGLVWIVIAYGATVWTFGVLFRMPEWLMTLSPFEHIPTLPIEAFRWAPLTILTAIGIALFIAGLGLVRRRDLTTN